MNETLLVCAAIVVLVVISLLCGHYLRGQDRRRIQTHLSSRGGRLLDVRSSVWDRPASLSVGYDDNRRWYRIRYFDRDGNERTALCRSSAMGIELEDDRVEHYVDEPNHPSPAQEAENRALREEEERLARRKPQNPSA